MKVSRVLGATGVVCALFQAALARAEEPSAPPKALSDTAASESDGGDVPSVRVHVLSKRRKKVTLLRDADTGFDERDAICASPCDVNLALGGRYRLLFEGHRSPPFTLSGEVGDEVSVAPRYPRARIGGWLVTGVGVATAFIGLSGYLLQGMGDEAHPCAGCNVAMGAGAVVALAGWLVLATSHTPGVSQSIRHPGPFIPSEAGPERSTEPTTAPPWAASGDPRAQAAMALDGSLRVFQTAIVAGTF